MDNSKGTPKRTRLRACGRTWLPKQSWLPPKKRAFPCAHNPLRNRPFPNF
nr:MAG TPA: hypothetical protein [Caudoviricetes sp.]